MGYREEKADKIINAHVLISMGAGAIPVPLVDITAVTAVQLDMIRELSYVYDTDFSEDLARNIISAVAGGTLAKFAASFIKTIPGLGSFLGGASMVALSGASTYAMGQVFIQHFKGGGILANFDFDFAKEMYEREFEKGKHYAEQMRKEKKKAEDVAEKPPQSKEDAFSKLELLNDLKERGILTEEEFNAKKEQILRDI